MNSLYVMGWSLLAQAGRFGDLGGSFRQPKNNLSGQEITFIVGAIVLAAIAIDKMTATLLTQKGGLRRGLFRSLDDDPALLEEIKLGAQGGKAVTLDAARA